MATYLDASVLVALVNDDAFSARATTLLRSTKPVVVISDLACAECASALGIEVRMRTIAAASAHVAFAALHAWVARVGQRTVTVAADISVAESFLRRLDLTLRTADAIHIAIARRVGATLATFDVKMADSARALGSDVAAI